MRAAIKAERFHVAITVESKVATRHCRLDLSRRTVAEAIVAALEHVQPGTNTSVLVVAELVDAVEQRSALGRASMAARQRAGR